MEKYIRRPKPEKPVLPKVLKKFDALRRRQKTLYIKAFDIMSAVTSVLKDSVNDFSATAYFASIAQMYKTSNISSNDQITQEAIAYCFSAIISMLDIAVIQNQHQIIFDIISNHMLSNNTESQSIAKYGLIALQFLLHSKTEQQWNGNDEETDKAYLLLMSSLIDRRGEKVQKQAQKSLCILFQNKKIEKLVKPMSAFQNFVTQVFNQQFQQKGGQASQKTILLLNFLAAALQIMPLSQCCDIDTKIMRLTSLEDSALKTHAYLTLEVFYASRRFTSNPEHVEQILRSLLDNQEVLSLLSTGRFQMNKGLYEQEEMRVVSYIQCTSQVMVNYSTTRGARPNDILKYVSACFSIFCEYFINTGQGIRNAAFTALRIILTQSLKKEHFQQQGQDGISSNLTAEILNLDALSLNDQMTSMMRGGSNGKNQGLSQADKVIIFIRYLLTSRFEDALDNCLKLMKTFIKQVGDVIPESADLLNVVALINPKRDSYNSWKDCIGAFLEVVGAEKFFQALPIQVVNIDMNSLTFAKDSRSYIIQIIPAHLKNGDLAFFISYFLPMLNAIDKMIKQFKQQQGGFEIKAKKYETIMIQIWELLPYFCQYNSPQLSSAFATIIPYLEPMINQNIYGLRIVALKSFSTLINHCRNTSVVSEEIKKTRTGLKRISLDYIEGLSNLYTSQSAETNLPPQEKQQILATLQDFSSIAMSVKLSNLFLTGFANLVLQFNTHSITSEKLLSNLEVLLAMMEKVKLKKENYLALMKGLKVFIDNQSSQKFAYKLLAKIIEKYELENIAELFQIQQELNPLLQGQASKQRLFLIKSYIQQLHKYKDDQSNLQQIGELLKLMIVELITAFSNTNKKIKRQAEDIFKSIFELIMYMKALPQLFQMLLVGFAGAKVSTQSATIRVLLLLLKLNYQNKDKNVNSIRFEDPTFQDFLRKVTKIITLFMRDHTSGNELHRSVLKYIKTVVSFLNVDQLKGELCESMFQGIFGIQSDKKLFNKHNMLIKKILSKFIKKMGLSYVKSITPETHQKLIAYIERDRRKRLNKSKKIRLLALIGKEKKEEAPTAGGDVDMKDGSDSSEDEQGYEEDDGEHSEKYSQASEGNDSDSEDDSDSESDNDEEEKGADMLMTDEQDIPRVDDIPVVSRLAKEKKQMQLTKLPKVEQLKNNKERITKMIDADEEQFESHFVENPFIKLREKAMTKNINSKQHMSLATLEGDDKNHDIYIMQETGKFMIQDLEEEEQKSKLQKQQLKRTRMQIGQDVEMQEDSSSDEDTDALKKRMQGLNKKSSKPTDSVKDNKQSKQQAALLKNKRQKKGEDDGHFVKYSGNTYQSSKGKGDVLKAGKYEPFAYIQLNPKMLNKRYKDKAVKSFEGVVSHGKKVGKRTGEKKTEGLFSGLTFKKD